MTEFNRIFCTFTTKEDLETDLQKIRESYTIPGNRIFILHAPEREAFLMTYSLEFGNLSRFPENTILVHRKKDFNVLYTINALNYLVQKVTGGPVDKKVVIDWQPYRSSLLVTEEGEFKQIKTKLFKILSLES